MKKKIRGFFPHLPFILLFIFMFYLDHFVYLYGDDYRYATYFSVFPHFKGQTFSIAQAIHNQIYDYLHINGRFFINIFSIFMLVNGIELWRWVNPFVLVVFAYLIFYVVHVRIPKQGDGWSSTLLVSLFFLIHLYIARQTLYYAIGSFNYVYPMVGLFLLAAYFRRDDMGKPVQNKIVLFFVFVLGFLVGWSQEQIAILAIGFVVSWLGKEWVKKRTVKKIHLFLFGITIVGFLGLFLAPGPKERAASAALTEYNNLTLVGKLKVTFPAMVQFFVHQQAIFTILVIIMLSIICYQYTKSWLWLLCGPIVMLPFIFEVPMFGQEKFVDKLLEHKLYLCLYGLLLMGLIALMSIFLAVKTKNYLLLVLPVGFIMINIATAFTPSIAGGRVAFPGIPLAMAAIVLLFNRIKGRGVKYQLVLVLVLCSFFNYYYLTKSYHANANIHEERIRMVEDQSKQIHSGVLQLPRLINRNPAGYELDEHEWVKRGFKDYYHIDSNVTIIVK